MFREHRREHSLEQYACTVCSYTTLDKSNAKKHAHEMTRRRIWVGTPHDLTTKRAIPRATLLAWFKHEMFESKTTPTSTDGLAALVASIPYSTLHRLVFGNVIDAMRKLFATTWSRDTVTNNESHQFQTNFRWRGMIVQYRSITGAGRTIDDFELITLPATKSTYRDMSFELFCTLGDIAYYVSNSSNRDVLGDKYLPRAATAWKTKTMTGVPECTTADAVTGFRPWMQQIADDIERFIPTRESMFTNRQPCPPGPATCLDPDAPTARLVKIHVCATCGAVHPNKQRIARHARTCKHGRADPVAVMACWYTDDERDRHDPFGPAEPVGLDRVHELDPTFSTAHAARVVAETVTSTGADRIVDVFRVCFSKYAHDPDWRRAIRHGRYICATMPVDGVVRHEKIPIGRVFNRFASWVFSIIELAYGDDPLDAAAPLDASNELTVGDLVNGNPAAFKTDCAKRINDRIVKLIPTLNEYHNEIIL